MNTEDLEKKLLFFTENEDGNPHAALFFFAGEKRPWNLDVGNPCASVRLGEVPGEMSFEGASLGEVIEQAEAHYLAKKAEAEGQVLRSQACRDFWIAGWTRKWNAQLQTDHINRNYWLLFYLHHRMMQAGH